MKKAGRRLRTEHLEVRTVDSLLSHARVAVVVAKHGHSIVERNRLRRRLRELVRTTLIPVAAGNDIVVRSMPAAYETSFDQLRLEVEEVSNRLAKKAVS